MMKPTLIVVADEIFQSQDATLRQVVSRMIPNTFKTANLLVANEKYKDNRWKKQKKEIEQRAKDRSINFLKLKDLYADHNLSREIYESEKQLQLQTYKSCNHVVQAHIFDGVYEAANQSVLEFLMASTHEIVSFKMFDQLIEIWLS